MQQLSPSELILNKRGAVYHLDLRPEELATLVLMVGDPDRVELVSRHFDKIELKRNNREFITHTGYIGPKRITVVSTGIGTDNIDIVLNELDALVNIDLESRMLKKELTQLQLIRLGTAGSLQQHIEVDSLVASTHGMGLDNLLHFYRHQHNDEEQLMIQSFITQTQINARSSQPYISGGSASLLKHFVKAFHQGITVTCPGFYAPQGRVLRLGLNNPELVQQLTGFRFGPYLIANFEMETAALYGLGRLMGHQCLSLSAIVANRVSRKFSADPSLCVNQLINHVLEVATSL